MKKDKSPKYQQINLGHYYIRQYEDNFKNVEIYQLSDFDKQQKPVATFMFHDDVIRYLAKEYL